MKIGAAGKWNLSSIYRCAAKSTTVYIEDNVSFPGRQSCAYPTAANENWLHIQDSPDFSTSLPA